jgi:hypothetical protein
MRDISFSIRQPSASSEAAMSSRNANDGNGAEGSLARDAGWSEVWAGLLLSLFVLGSAILVAILFSGGRSTPLKEDEVAALHTKYLHDVRDPTRPRWRTTDTPWNLMGTHEIAGDIDRGWEEAIEERDSRGATIETSSVDISPRPE